MINPVPGFYGIPQPNYRNSKLDNVAVTIEDRLKLTPWLALIGGIRVEDLTLTRDGINFDGSVPAGQPFTKQLAAGVLSRGRDVRAGQGADVLRHVRHRL